MFRELSGASSETISNVRIVSRREGTFLSIIHRVMLVHMLRARPIPEWKRAEGRVTLAAWTMTQISRATTG